MTDVLQHIRLDADRTPVSARILVVDEDPAICEMIRDNFAGEGYEVESCYTGDETYNLDLSQYELVLLDLSIDDNNGLGVVEQIKQIYEPDEVAVIAYSVKMSPQTIIQALNAGADDYLIKPFSIRELKARVRSVLRRR
ncbi:MAG: response regulator transcription factor [Muribaculaceae bacterium]|nr:response regulator transcription factor [Muribaculaceae bacterium]